MISSIEISGYATYKKPVTFDFLDKKGNPTNMTVIYGPNGTGKSTFTKLVREYIENRSPNSPVSISHDMGGTFAKRVLIYDKKFVLENFEESDTQPGFFSLGKISIETEKQLKEIERRIKEVKENIEIVQKDIQSLEKKRVENETRLDNDLFEIKKEYENTALDFCLAGVKGSKSKLSEKLKRQAASETDDVSIQMLMQQASVVQDQDVPELPYAHLDENREESDTIWSQVIVPIGKSCYKEVVDRLNSHQWIEQGIEYAEKMNGLCPFCQQEMRPNTVDDLKIIFDKTYEISRKRIDYLKSSYGQYEETWKNVKRIWSEFIDKCSIDSIRIKTREMIKNIDTACDICAENMMNINKKIDNPELVIALTSTKSNVDIYNNLLDEINQIYQKATDTKDISLLFWKIMRNKYDERIKEFDKKKKEITSEIAGKQERESNLNDDYSFLRVEVKRVKEQLSSYGDSAENINKSLEELGVQGFSLVVVDENKAKKYRIVRDGENLDSDVYRSLSEGEKTIISLLYFCEHCRSKSEQLQDDDIVVILDDPVSSLSANHLYNICQIIKERLAENFKQVILLSHSIFFIYEIYQVMSNSKPKIKPIYFLLTKRGGQTDKVKLGDNFSISIYDSYWEELCKIKKYSWKGLAPPQTLNIMRNIVERFFGFIERTDLSKDKSIISKMKPEDRAFYRRINRESHSDMPNESREPVQFADIWDQFRKYFIHKGYGEYFDLLCSATEKRLEIEAKPDDHG